MPGCAAGPRACIQSVYWRRRRPKRALVRCANVLTVGARPAGARPAGIGLCRQQAQGCLAGAHGLRGFAGGQVDPEADAGSRPEADWTPSKEVGPGTRPAQARAGKGGRGSA